MINDDNSMKSMEKKWIKWFNLKIKLSYNVKLNECQINYRGENNNDTENMDTKNEWMNGNKIQTR